jgi:hypothetical protein
MDFSMLSRINWQTPIESRDGPPGDATSSASKSKARAVPAHNGVRLHVDLVFAAPRPNEATPAVVGRIAQEAGGGQLIVSHFGLFNRDAAIADLRKFCSGPLIVGADLQCTPVQ